MSLLRAAWAQFLAAACGLWLIVAPDVLGYDDPAWTNDRIVGPIIVALSVIAISGVLRNLRWGVLPLGIWLLVAPFPLGYDTIPLLNSIVVGLLVTALSLVHGTVSNRYGGGWASLLPGREVEDVWRPQCRHASRIIHHDTLHCPPSRSARSTKHEGG